MALLDEEREQRRDAVIEAARAAKADLRGYMRRHHELFGTSNPHFKHPFDGLLEAVEALEAIEPAAAKDNP